MFATLFPRIGSISTLICGLSGPIALLFALVACCQVADLHAIEPSRPVGSQDYKPAASIRISVSSACDGTAQTIAPENIRSASGQFQKTSFKLVNRRRCCSSKRQHSREFTSDRRRSHRGSRRGELSIRKSVEVNRSSAGITVPHSLDRSIEEPAADPNAPPDPADFH